MRCMHYTCQTRGFKKKMTLTVFPPLASLQTVYHPRISLFFIGLCLHLILNMIQKHNERLHD